ncbi:protein AIR2-like [Helianthus annuus]|uniref:protein AIR2-like n=1 Tax=Helianthus annuus TaxID=4232 RepID=UPI000B8FF78C|nr:protein AIR2-like [Helianthus annuus]
MEQSIWELAPQALSLMIVSTPPTTMIAHMISLELTKEALRLGRLSIPDKKKETPVEASEKNKRKLSEFQGGDRADNKDEVKKGSEYMGKLPQCDKCRRHHTRRCKKEKCDNCGKVGHSRKTCWHETKCGKKSKGCYNCGDMGHFRKDCPRKIKPNRGKNV